MQSVDFLIVGAGFAGLVAAHQLSCAGFSCAVVEKRSHLGGNAYDCYDEAGVLIHPYGPHYFRTNSPKIREFLSQFTEWHEVEYQIRSWARGRLWSFPINLNTFEEWLGRASSAEEFEGWLAEQREEIESPKNSEEVILSQVGRELYELFFRGYTEKQWKRHPRDLDASVCGRIPVRTNRDDRYLSESFQALPKDGYTRMFERMVANSPEVEVRLGMDFEQAKREFSYRHLIFTGPIDEYFERCFGALPYRSLRFEHESFSGEELVAREKFSGKSGHYQAALQVNYPEVDVPYTRIVEMKHATGQVIEATSIVREFPQDYDGENEPFYPIPAADAAALYQRYAELAKAEDGVTFIGRLATYRYYNMDQVVGMALVAAEKLIERFRSANEE